MSLSRALTEQHQLPQRVIHDYVLHQSKFAQISVNDLQNHEPCVIRTLGGEMDMPLGTYYVWGLT